MPFKITYVNNSSDPSDEYVVLKATGLTNNLGYYAVVDKTFFPDGQQSNKFRHIFRFKSKLVKKGEYVILISGRGTPRSFTDSAGDYVHYIYWNSDECVWNDKGDTAYLIKYSKISELQVEKLK
jgi:hypothetical protein